MRDEISQEAQAALAQNRLKQARERLRRDGGESLSAMQRRVLALAAERSIPPADYKKLLYRRVSTGAVMDFGKKYKVNFDWLLAGDLKGLARMKQGARAEPRSRPVMTSDEFRRAYESLGEKERAVISQYLTLMAKKGDGPPPQGGAA